MIGNKTCRVEECAVGNFITDAWRIATGSQIAIINSGDIRYIMIVFFFCFCSHFWNRSNLEPGNITVGDIYNILPYPDDLSTFQLSGFNLWLTVQSGLARTGNDSVLGDTGRFLQISGMRFVWNPDAPLPNRIISIDILNATTGVYSPINLNAIYS